jgi:hypothetical protein
MFCLLFKFTLALNSALPFWKLLVSEFLLGISETLLRSTSAPQVKIVSLLMLFVGTLTYVEPKLFFLIIFHNGPCIILKHEFYGNSMCIRVHIIFSLRNIFIF